MVIVWLQGSTKVLQFWWTHYLVVGANPGVWLLAIFISNCIKDSATFKNKIRCSDSNHDSKTTNIFWMWFSNYPINIYSERINIIYLFYLCTYNNTTRKHYTNIHTNKHTNIYTNRSVREMKMFPPYFFRVICCTWKTILSNYSLYQCLYVKLKRWKYLIYSSL